MKMHKNILARYIGSTLIKATLLVLLILMGVEIFILLATQLHTLGKGSYNLWQALMYVLLVLPQETYALFPVAGLLGMLFGLSLLANHTELVSMRAAGVSPMQITRYALQAGIILTILMVIIGEGIGPFAKHWAEERKVAATSSGHALKTRQGLWLRKDHTFYYISTIYSPHHIANVSRYRFNETQQLQSASFSQEGIFQHHRWQMKDVKKSQIFPDHVIATEQPTAQWNLAIDPRLLEISMIEPSEMSLRQLSAIIRYQNRNQLTATNLRVVFWQRLFQPFAILLMMFLAIPFMFGPLRNVTTGLRLVMGVVVGFAFYLSNQLFPPLSQVYDFPPFIAVVIPLLLFFIAGGWMFRRIG